MANCLTLKQQRFVDEYIATGNATEASRRAGYGNPRQQGAENLSKPYIQQEIANRTKDIQSAKIATARERQEFWTSIMRGEDDEAEMKDRLKASELLGKCHGDFLDRVESTGQQEIIVRYVRE